MGQRRAGGVCALAAIGLALGGCNGGGNPPSEPPSQRYTLVVRVLDSTVAPVENATVLLSSLTSSTAANGEASFPDLSPGNYQVSVSHPSTTAFYSSTVALQSNAVIDVSLPVSDPAEFRVVATLPKVGQPDVRLDAPIWFGFNADVDLTTVSPADFQVTPELGPFEILQNSSNIGLELAEVESSSRLVFKRQLPVGIKITIRLTGEVLDQAGRPLAEQVQLQFITASEDTFPPVMKDTVPGSGPVLQPINSTFRFVFNEDLAPVSREQFHTTPQFDFELQLHGNEVIIFPTQELLPLTDYEVSLRNVGDLLGNFQGEGASTGISFATGEHRAPIYNIQPEWSSALNTIVFSSNRAGNYDIYRIEPNGSGLAPLTASVQDDFNPTLSADGQLLAWQAHGSYEDWEIFVAPLSDPASAVTVTPSDANDTEPRFTRTDSRSIVFVSDRLGIPQIFRMNADGSGYSAVSASLGNAQASPAPHPLIDNQLLFTSSGEGSLDIWSMSISAIDGSATVLNQSDTLSFLESQPDWGADASYYVYISDQGGVDNLWLGDLAGGHRRVTSFTLPLASPSVDPLSGTGRCVASLTKANGGSDLVIIDLVAGEIVRNLTSPGEGN